LSSVLGPEKICANIEDGYLRRVVSLVVNSFPPTFKLITGGYYMREKTSIMLLYCMSYNNLFIDRNGKHFDHILDFLRDDKYLPPKDVMKEVLKDANYFGLNEYVYRLQPFHIYEPTWNFEYA
jgi:hypothetical protein